jgi:hypothetical protein
MQLGRRRRKGRSGRGRRDGTKVLLGRDEDWIFLSVLNGWIWTWLSRRGRYVRDHIFCFFSQSRNKATQGGRKVLFAPPSERKRDASALLFVLSRSLIFEAF